MLTSDRFNCMVEIGKDSTYRGFPIRIDFSKDATIEILCEIDNSTTIRDASIATVFNKVDALLRRKEENARIKVDEPVLILVKGEWKEGSVKSLGMDGSARVQIGKGGLTIPKDDVRKRCVMPTEKVKDALEELISYEEIIGDAQKSADEIRAKLTYFNPTPYFKVREEEIKKSEEEAQKKAEAEEKAAAKAAAKAAKAQKKVVIVRKSVFTRRK